ncbi:MAG: hypothetical protein EVG15_09485 [Candidatus Acididesulfobacter diazotrophicus]|jgi:hypothetical protein|uniref:Sulfotransferase domain-containing protein n=1 Tax=Candidatus Acididesulfobacter diazotrophicus TaxID=2597226 RepID=A0A519BKI5_9DELT|nr:MAG: hypothetical protein EVG15_09485 [Candidatus Acididesulfobacter diazotrophicus]
MNVKKILNFLKLIPNKLRGYINFSIYQMELPKNPLFEDIYIVEFPKSGITWLSFIIANIHNQLENNQYIYPTYFNIDSIVTDVHNVKGLSISEQSRIRFIKSHSKYNPHYNFVIYLLRNPFDVMVSYYNFSIAQFEYKQSFERFIKDKNYGITSWTNHVDSWLNYSNKSQMIHLLKYEDLIHNTFNEIKELYNNLGILITDETIQNAINLSSLENMRNSEEIYRKHNPFYILSFVGKKDKIKKNKLLTRENFLFIKKRSESILKKFYPDLLNKDYIEIITDKEKNN